MRAPQRGRKKAGLAQDEVARRLGVYCSYASKYEKGERRPDVLEFLEVTEAIGADAAAILKRLRVKS